MSSCLGHEIIQRLENEGTKVDISGLSVAARAYALADILANTSQRIAIICPDATATTRMHHDIKTFLILMGRSELATTIDYFPGWEHSPYRVFAPSIKNK